MDISSEDSDWFSELMQEMDDSNETNPLMYDYELPAPDMSINHRSSNLSPDPLFEFSGQSSFLQKPSTSPPPPPPEVSSSSSSPLSKIICFGLPTDDSIDDPTMSGFSYGNLATLGATVLGTGRNTVLRPTESHPNKHQQAGNTAYNRSAVIKPFAAERNRREKLNQHFIALSAQIPGLKKIDRASVLEEATKYLKQLKEKMKTLEEDHKSLQMSSCTKTSRSQDETADVVNKKMKCDGSKQVENSKNNEKCDSDDTNNVNEDDFSTSSCEGINYGDGRLPEIEAKVSHNNMFIRIHCEKHQGVLGKVIKEIEKLHLTVLQSSAMPSGNSTLYVTIISQMDIEFCLTAKDTADYLKAIFGQFRRVTAA